MRKGTERNILKSFRDFRMKVDKQASWYVGGPIYKAVCVEVVWVWNLVADIEGGKEAEGVWEYGVEENIWT